ncbi:MAG: hypothetical protein AAGH15_08370 [Myxococcota bacterium]
MTDDAIRERDALRREVEALRAELAGLRAERARGADVGRKARSAMNVLRPWRLLIPLFDRHKVVRSFGSLMGTVSRYSEPQGEWPTRDEVLVDTRTFLESVARYQVRRRTLVFLVSLFAAVIPALQIWLVVQQNEIIENQNEYFEIQVYDLVARSMTEGDPNARLMTGALLANAQLDFLGDVVEEAFDPSLLAQYRAGDVDAPRRLEDAAFRGHLVRAVSRSLERGGPAEDMDADGLFEVGRPMVRRILSDAADRIPQVLRIGARGSVPAELREQVDHYLFQIGALLRSYGRVCRSAGEADAYLGDLGPLLRRLSERRALGEGQVFAEAYRTSMQDVLFEVALESERGSGPVDLAGAGLEPEEALRRGLATLREGEAEGVRWGNLEAQVLP